ncbi:MULTISPECIES: hypothetical protein [unclassified Nonomuraea]|uniref:hypothetical protein n=1 Tax=unclassified Nonomuraea TaxID=2593643 RepID=UPI003406A41A
MGLTKGNWKKQKAEAAKILTEKDRLSASKSRVDEVARTLRHDGREAAERHATEIYRDPTYGI